MLVGVSVVLDGVGLGLGVGVGVSGLILVDVDVLVLVEVEVIGLQYSSTFIPALLMFLIVIQSSSPVAPAKNSTMLPI